MDTLVPWGTILTTSVPWGTSHTTIVSWGTIHTIYVPWGTIYTRGVPRVRLGGQTTTNVFVSAFVSECTDVLAKFRSLFPKFILMNSSLVSCFLVADSPL